jgi:hypothetical protein
MEIIETENGLFVKGTNSILQAKGFVLQSDWVGPTLMYAQVLSSEGVPYVWLSSRPGEPDALPEEDQ